MCVDVFVFMVECIDVILFLEFFFNLLDVIEGLFKEFFCVFEDCFIVCEVFEIMILCCEYVDEFVGVQEEVGCLVFEFFEKIECMYWWVGDGGYLCLGFDLVVMVCDIWVFISGLLYLMFGCQ